MSGCICGHIYPDHDQATERLECKTCDCPEYRMVGPNGQTTRYRTRVRESLRADDEPVFTIRAQDILAPQALAAYAALARKLDLHDHAQRVEAIAVDFLAWQAAHAKQVKRPD